jgi:HEAT repeat protein
VKKYKELSSEKLFSNLINKNLEEDDYWENIRELRTRPSNNVYEKSYELATSKNLNHKSVGILILAQLGFNPRFNESKTISLFFNLLDSNQENEILENILYSIGHNNSNLTQEQINILSKFYNHEVIKVREALVSTLLAVNNPIEVLIHLSQDSEDQIRDWATFGIGSQLDNTSPEILEALWKRTKDSNDEVRAEAIVGLVNRKVPEVKKIILNILMSGNFGTLEMETIQDLEDKDYLPLLKMNFEKYKEDKGISEDWLSALQSTIQDLEA